MFAEKNDISVLQYYKRKDKGRCIEIWLGKYIYSKVFEFLKNNPDFGVIKVD